jgi:hypothetical protein
LKLHRCAQQYGLYTQTSWQLKPYMEKATDIALPFYEEVRLGSSATGSSAHFAPPHAACSIPRRTRSSFALVQELLQRRKKLDFDDLLIYFVRMLRDHPRVRGPAKAAAAGFGLA